MMIIPTTLDLTTRTKSASPSTHMFTDIDIWPVSSHPKAEAPIERTGRYWIKNTYEPLPAECKALDMVREWVGVGTISEGRNTEVWFPLE